ncbi:MAG: SRPBCC family protein [Elainellaceae cyanobacterium]
MFGIWFRPSKSDQSRSDQSSRCRFQPLAVTFQTVSSASAEDLWQHIVNLADVSWHPMLTSTNVPSGLLPKPGLIFRAVTRLSPFPIHIFVERVHPQELLSVRIIAMPGVEERGTYRIESTVCGTRVSYSVTLSGWLSPIAWSVIRPYAAQVAAALAEAAEQGQLAQAQRRPRFQDLLGVAIALVGGGVGSWFARTTLLIG